MSSARSTPWARGQAIGLSYWFQQFTSLTSIRAFIRIRTYMLARGAGMSKHLQTAGLVLALLFAPAAWPQGGNSTVRGSVRDQAQAVIPSATITLTNVNTNVARTTQSNEA